MLKVHSSDEQIRCKTDGDFEVNKEKLVGIFLPVLKSRHLLVKAYNSLVDSMPDGYPFGIIVVDGGSGDGTVEWCNNNNVPCYGNHMPKDQWRWQTSGLCKETPNACIEALLGKWLPNQQRFEREDRYGYVCWLHADMTFPQVGWLGRLVEIYEKTPNVGILGPQTDQYLGMHHEMQEGNVAPFIISVAKLKEHYIKYGWFYPPEMWFCVGYCDWAMHARFMSMGYKSLVAREVLVGHPMMGTREILYKTERGPRDRAWEENKRYYREHYKTVNDPWNSQKI